MVGKFFGPLMGANFRRWVGELVWCRLRLIGEARWARGKDFGGIDVGCAKGATEQGEEFLLRGGGVAGEGLSGGFLAEVEEDEGAHEEFQERGGD